MGLQLVTLGLAYVALLTGCSLLAGLALGATTQPASAPPAATLEPPLISTVAVPTPLATLATLAPQATAVPAPTLPPSAPGAGGKCELIHVVEAGDTVLGLARRYGTTVEAIASANNLETTASLKIGYQLIIPLCAPTPAP
ncbi:MAG: LysM peptidoglycan-binding domain-containing protein [Thermoflexales bacterium]|nr:LysM peptidoglycan-binding domain-containing protein [Thermoflexales bacterium]